MQENCTSGPVRGALSDRRLYATLSLDGAGDFRQTTGENIADLGGVGRGGSALEPPIWCQVPMQGRRTVAHAGCLL